MIDDVTLVASLGERWEHAPRGNVKPALVPVPEGGTRRGWAVIGNGWYLRVCPANGDLSLKLSIPRLAGQGLANFPLVSISSWNREQTAREVAFALGVENPEQWVESLATAFMSQWGVTAVAYAIDVKVASPIDVCEAFRRIPTRQSKLQAWGAPSHSVQYETNTTRLMLYAKEHALRRQIPRAPRHKIKELKLAKDARKALIEQAKGILRIEVTHRGSRAIRELAGLPGGQLPTLEWISDLRVASSEIEEQLRRRGLFEDATREVVPSGAVDIVRFLSKLSAFSNDGRKPLRGPQLLATAMLLQLSQEMTPDEIEGIARLTQGSFYRLWRKLKEMGVQRWSGGPKACCLIDLAQAVTDALRPSRPDCFRLPHEHEVVEAPWAERLGLLTVDVDGDIDGIGFAGEPTS